MMRLISLFNLQLTVSVLRDLVERKVTITINNKSGFEWKNPSTYFYSGTADDNLPSSVSQGKSEFCKCRGAFVK